MTQFGQPQQQFAPQGYQPPAPPQQFQQQAPAPQFGQPPAQQWAPQTGAEAMPDQDTSGMFGGAPSISWDNKTGYVNGTPRGGMIVAKKTSQQTDFETKAARFFPNGQPMMQIELTLQTSERTDANDDGKRTMYVKSGLVKSAAEAFRAKGARDLELGGWFYAAKTGQNGGKNGKGNTFQSVYARPGEADPMAGRPPYVAPQVPQSPAPQFQNPVQPNYPQPGQFQQPAAPQQFAPAAQHQAPAPQFGAPPAQQGYADPNQGQQFAPQAPAQPPFGAQQPAPPAQGGGAPADYNPFAQR